MPESWRELRQEPERVCELLEVAERGGFPAAIVLLDGWGLRWSPGKAPPPYPPPAPESARFNADRTEALSRRAIELINRHRFHTMPR
jgi:hypothetical protein